MRIQLPKQVEKIIEVLEANGFEAYAVGGCVRDTLLAKTPKDWDITTSATPQQVKALFTRTIDTGIAHGTVTVMMDHEGYEVTTYRIDGEYEDSRHPKEVTFTSNLLEDLRRRDFTINAMAYNPTRGLVDAYCGEEDLKLGRIRCVGDPMERFSEDALRMLRAVRFAAQLGFTIDEHTKDAARTLAPTLRNISAERIATELLKTIESKHPEKILEAYELGLTAIFLPEFDTMMQTEQVNKHHCYSVGMHTVHALMEVRADRILRLSMLFHDIAKPVCLTTDEKGQNHFKGHPVEGERMTKEILKRLKLDNHTIDLVCKMVRYHDDRPELSERNVRRAMNRISPEYFPLLFEVKRADTLAQSMYKRKEKLAYVETYKQIYEEILEKKQCVGMADLAIGGNDLIAMGIPRGKEIGRILNALLERVLDHPEENTRENLLEQAHKMMPPDIG